MLRVYGASDDLIEVEGDIEGEVGCYGTDEQDNGVLLVFSDGTMLEIKYGKSKLAIWEIKLIRKGELFLIIEPCTDEDADIHSDIAKFKDGIKWVYAATEWKAVK